MNIMVVGKVGPYKKEWPVDDVQESVRQEQINTAKKHIENYFVSRGFSASDIVYSYYQYEL